MAFFFSCNNRKVRCLPATVHGLVRGIDRATLAEAFNLVPETLRICGLLLQHDDDGYYTVEELKALGGGTEEQPFAVTGTQASTPEPGAAARRTPFQVLTSRLPAVGFDGFTEDTADYSTIPRKVIKWDGVHAAVEEHAKKLATTPDVLRHVSTDPPAPSQTVCNMESALTAAFLSQVTNVIQPVLAQDAVRAEWQASLPPLFCPPGHGRLGKSGESSGKSTSVIPDLYLVAVDLMAVLVAGEVKPRSVMNWADDFLPRYAANEPATARSIVHQEMCYLDVSGARFGVITSYNVTYLVHRPEMDVLEISDPFLAHATGFTSVRMALIWLQQQAVDNLRNRYVELILRQVPTEPAAGEGGRGGPGDCKADQTKRKREKDSEDAQQRDAPTSATKSLRSASLPLLKEEELQLGPIIGQGVGSRVVRGYCNGMDAAVKLVRAPEFVPASSYMYEHRVYQQLGPLQGTIVPQVLRHGYVDCGPQGVLYFLAMELIVGTPLSELPQPLTAAVKSAALAALQQVHEQDVLHGDIHLRHLLLADAAGDVPVVKVIDFDCALLDGTEDEFVEEREILRELLGV